MSKEKFEQARNEYTSTIATAAAKFLEAAIPYVDELETENDILRNDLEHTKIALHDAVHKKVALPPPPDVDKRTRAYRQWKKLAEQASATVQ